MYGVERARARRKPVLAQLAKHSRFHMHFTSTSSSWLNLVERWFRELTDKALRRGVFIPSPTSPPRSSSTSRHTTTTPSHALDRNRRRHPGQGRPRTRRTPSSQSLTRQTLASLDLLATVPYLFGFHPTASLVVISLRRNRMGLIARIDFPYADEVAAAPPLASTPAGYPTPAVESHPRTPLSKPLRCASCPGRVRCV